MKFQSLWLALLLFAASGFALAGIPAHPPIPAGIGVNIHFTDPQPGEMKEMADSGVRWVRMDFSWAQTERARGRYNFSAYDRLLAGLAPFHIRAILILDYSNKLYDRDLSPYTGQGRQAFARWAVAAAGHFRGRGVVWEMYNEPNGNFWKPRRNDQDYIKLALAVGEALKEGAPRAAYIGPASSLIDLGFLKACFQAGLLHYWDAVSVHPYRLRTPETVAPEYAALRKLIKTYAPSGKTIPIIAGEWGYSSTWFWEGMSNVLQANFLAREFLSDIAAGIPITIWYDWHDDGDNPRLQEANFGLTEFPYRSTADPVFARKPAYLALRTLSRVLGGYRFAQRLAVGGGDDYVLRFTGASGSRLAAWTTAWQPHRITLPGAMGRFQVIGLQGDKLSNRRELTVVLTDAPKYLVP